jgi:virulence-associated protein VagC
MGAIAKLSSEYGLSLPEWAIQALGNPTHVDIAIEDDRLVLTPTPDPDSAEAARRHVEQLGITEQDVDAAVASARQSP